jgi:hypothetical protein
MTHPFRLHYLDRALSALDGILAEIAAEEGGGSHGPQSHYHASWMYVFYTKS